jgi:hypothetical protein
MAPDGSNAAANTQGMTSDANAFMVKFFLDSRVEALLNAFRPDHPRRVVPPASIVL